MLTLDTPNLTLIAADGKLARAAADHPANPAINPTASQNAPDDAVLSRMLGAIISPAWPPEILVDAQVHFAEQLQDHPDEAGWWVWYILRKAVASGSQCELIGAAGFAGPVDSQQQVQLGYAIVQPHQNCGYATQAAEALTQWALGQEHVARVVAQTYPELKASVRVLEKIGMTQTGPGTDPGTMMFTREK